MGNYFFGCEFCGGDGGLLVGGGIVSCDCWGVSQGPRKVKLSSNQILVIFQNI